MKIHNRKSVPPSSSLISAGSSLHLDTCLAFACPSLDSLPSVVHCTIFKDILHSEAKEGWLAFWPRIQMNGTKRIVIFNVPAEHHLSARSPLKAFPCSTCQVLWD